MNESKLVKLFIRRKIKSCVEVFSVDFFNDILIIAFLNLLFIFISETYKYVVFITFQYITVITYWFILGVMSTIGLGFGFHTGILFLFPKIIEEYDGSLTNTFYNNFIPILLWSIGSSVGELPPYFMMLNGKESVEEYLGEGNWFNVKLNKLLLKVNNKNVRRLTIVFLASWPNVTFDMCGLVCGYIKLPVYEFLIPTIIGKTLIKTPIQIISLVWFLEQEYTQQYNSVWITWIKYIFFIIIFSIGAKSVWKYIVDAQKKHISDCFYKAIING